MIKMKHLANQEGSFTLEIAMILPLIFFMTIALIYFSFYLHDKAVIKSIANEGAELGAEIVTNRYKNINTGYVSSDDIEKEGLYWRLYDSNKGYKEQKIKEYLQQKMKRTLLFSISKVNAIEVDYINGVLKDEIKVRITNRLEIPVPFVSSLLGGDNMGIKVEAESKATISEPTEFIRNMILMDEIANKFELLRNSKEKYDQQIDSIIQFFRDINP